MAIERTHLHLKDSMIAEGIRIDVPDVFLPPTPEEIRVNMQQVNAIVDETDFDSSDSVVESFAKVHSIESVFSDFIGGTDLYLDGSDISVPLFHDPGSPITACLPLINDFSPMYTRRI